MTDLASLRDDLRETEAQATALLAGIQEIELQLGAPGRLSRTTGLPMTEDEFSQWRIRANYAKNRKLQEYRALKARIHELRDALFAQENQAALTARQRDLLEAYAADLDSNLATDHYGSAAPSEEEDQAVNVLLGRALRALLRGSRTDAG